MWLPVVKGWVLVILKVAIRVPGDVQPLFTLLISDPAPIPGGVFAVTLNRLTELLKLTLDASGSWEVFDKVVLPAITVPVRVPPFFTAGSTLIPNWQVASESGVLP